MNDENARTMKYDPKVHSKAHLLKALVWKLAGWFPTSPAPPGDLVVLNYHGTQRAFQGSFEEQIRYFRDHFRIFAPDELEGFSSHRPKTFEEPSLLLSFDDGLKNNLNAAAVLAKYGIKAIFFVIPALVEAPVDKQLEVFQEFVRPNVNSDIDSLREDLTPMTWDDLLGLLTDGHEIGCHSFTHMLRANTKDEAKRRHEIVESKRVIECSLGMEEGAVRSFCGPVDSQLSLGVPEMTLIMEHYAYCFSSYPGSNKREFNPYFIKRVNVEAYWMLPTVAYAMSRLDWPRWHHKRVAFSRVVERAQRAVESIK